MKNKKYVFQVGDVCILKYRADGKPGMDGRYVTLVQAHKGAYAIRRKKGWQWTANNFEQTKKGPRRGWDWEKDLAIITPIRISLEKRMQELKDF